MNVLHIANLDNDGSTGPNINVPKNVIYGSKYANVALYNLYEADPPIEISKKYILVIGITKTLKSYLNHLIIRILLFFKEFIF